MMKRRVQKRPRPMIQVAIPKGKIPDYKDVALLAKFMSERGKIFGRTRTGVSAKEQRAVTHAIKRARHLALLPFTARI